MESLLDAIQARYDGVRDMRARFEQKSYVASLGKENTSKGLLVVKRPGRMRWEYDEPDERVIVLDGETLRIYTPEDQQLQIAPLQDGTVSPTALGFLLGESKLRDTFKARRLPAGKTDHVGLKLIPRQESGFEYLELWIDPETHALVESVVVDLFANRTRLSLTDVQENRGTVEADFSISVPDDTDVIDLR